jgi:hypothetical protein
MRVKTVQLLVLLIACARPSVCESCFNLLHPHASHADSQPQLTVLQVPKNVETTMNPRDMTIAMSSRQQGMLA